MIEVVLKVTKKSRRDQKKVSAGKYYSSRPKLETHTWGYFKWIMENKTLGVPVGKQKITNEPVSDSGDNCD